MTVAELIEKLREMPQDATVAVLGPIGCITEDGDGILSATEVERMMAKWQSDGAYSQWWSSVAWNYDKLDGEPCEIVFIS